MSLLENINQDIKKAMLAKEKDKLEALRAIKNSILVKQTEKNASDTLSPDDEIRILQRLVKQRQEAADLYTQQNRDDLAQVELFQKSIISEYLPKQMNEDEIADKLKQIIQELGAEGMKDMGKVMGRATKDFAGKADNKIVSKWVKNLLAG